MNYEKILKDREKALKNDLLKNATYTNGEILFRDHRLWHRGTKNLSEKNRELLGIMFIKSKNCPSENFFFNYTNKNVSINSNIFNKTFKGRLKEFIYIYAKFVFQSYKIVLSIVKNI